MILKKLEERGFVFPKAPQALASYVPCVITGPLLYVSGQLPMRDGTLAYQGKVGKEIDQEAARDAAVLCCLNILAQVNHALDSEWSRIKCCVRLGGFIQCIDTFHAHSLVMNGASELMIHVLGEKGMHARTSIGVASLPLNAAIEVEALFEIER